MGSKVYGGLRATEICLFARNLPPAIEDMVKAFAILF